MSTAKTAAAPSSKDISMARIIRRAREIEIDLAAGDAERAAERRRIESFEAETRSIASALSAEREAFSAAGLTPLDASDTQGHTPIRYHDQAVMLVNSNAHPGALMATALARAERAQAFARVLEQFEIVRHDRDLEAGTYTLARMIEEVVDLIQVAREHTAIVGAPPSAMRAE